MWGLWGVSDLLCVMTNSPLCCLVVKIRKYQWGAVKIMDFFPRNKFENFYSLFSFQLLKWAYTIKRKFRFISKFPFEASPPPPWPLQDLLVWPLSFRKMKALLPLPSLTSLLAGGGEASRTLIEKYKDRDLCDMVLLHSKEAAWDNKLNSYVLNFRGRASQVRTWGLRTVCADQHLQTRQFSFIQ